MTLDARALLEEACRRTGLDDFGDDTLPERFGLAVGLLNQQGLDGDGDAAAAQNCLWLLTSRLAFFEDFKRYPITEEVVEKPVFATGEGRSGTTLLHALLSVAKRLVVMNFGKLIADGAPDEIMNSREVRSVYLGEDAHV